MSVCTQSLSTLGCSQRQDRELLIIEGNQGAVTSKTSIKHVKKLHMLVCGKWITHYTVQTILTGFYRM